MNILTDTLPNCVNIGGKLFPINTDFRVGIHFEQLMLDEGISAETKFMEAKQLYFGETLLPPKFDEEITDKILWFYRCGKDEKKKAQTTHERVYDFDYDSKWIFAAFKEQYQIQIDENLKMHWWTFRALFDALSDDTEFVKIMGYRAIKISDKIMKRLHKLPMSKAEEKRINDIEDALINRKNLENVL